MVEVAHDDRRTHRRCSAATISEMPSQVFAAALVVGAALIAAWADLRLGSRRPASMRRRVIAAAAAFALLQIVGDALRVGMSAAPSSARLAAIFMVMLPLLVAAFVAALWLLRTIHELGVGSRS